MFVEKLSSELNFASKMYNYNNFPSRTESLRLYLYNAEESIVSMSLRHADRFLPLKGANGPLFSVYILRG